jgi:hypothetical protein
MKKITKRVDVDGQEVNIYVRNPTNGELTSADRIRAKSWTRAMKDPDVVSKKQLEKILKEKGAWGKDKQKQQENLFDEIISLERRLTKPGKKKVKLSEARRIAIEMRKKRSEYRELISEKLELEQNTAESIADNDRFDYLVCCCSFYEEGDKKVYTNLEDYKSKDSDQIAYTVASALAEMMYNLDESFEKNLPENRFLLEQNLASSSNLFLTDLEGNYVDEDFKPLVEEVIEEQEIIEYENDLVASLPIKKTAKKKTVRKRKTTTTQTSDS